MSVTDPEDPARLAQLHQRIRSLEEEIAELKRTLPSVARSDPVATTPVPVTTPTPSGVRSQLSWFEPNYDLQTPTFSQMGLKPELVSALRENGFIKPTALQSAALVPLIQGKTALLSSPAGGGRTVSYALAALQAIDPSSKHVQVLILAASKTRATQIVHDIRALSGGIWDTDNALSRVYPCLSGTKTDQDRNALSNRPNIVVGTPGRVFHLLDRAHLPTSHLRLLIADEADDLLSTFRQLVTEIIRFLPTPSPEARRGLQTVWAADHLGNNQMLNHALRYAPDPVCVAVRHSDGVWRVVPARDKDGERQYQAKI